MESGRSALGQKREEADSRVRVGLAENGQSALEEAAAVSGRWSFAYPPAAAGRLRALPHQIDGAAAIWRLPGTSSVFAHEPLYELTQRHVDEPIGFEFRLPRRQAVDREKREAMNERPR